MEEEGKGKVEAEAAKVARLRDDFRDLSAANEEERSLLRNLLEERRSAAEKNLSDVREEGRRQLEDQRKATEEKLALIAKEADEAREESSRVQLSIEEEQEKLSRYSEEKNEELSALKEEAENRFKALKDKLLMTASKEAELKERHHNRVNELKTGIAESFSEYDELMRLKPQIVSSTMKEEEKELLEKADGFRRRIDTLEESHQDLMKELSSRKEEAIASLQNEIASLLKDKEVLSARGEKELEELSSAYEALVQGEKAKAEELKIELLKKHDESQAIVKEREEALRLIEEDYRNRLSALEEEDRKQKEEASSRDEEEIRKQNDVLEGAKQKTRSLYDTLRYLKSRYDAVDEEIRSEKNRLAESYRKRSEELDSLYSEALEKQKDRLRSLDIIKEENHDLFRSR